VRYPRLAEFLAFAEITTGIEIATLEKVCQLGLAQSALGAPEASFGGEDFYPDATDKAAVLCAHLAWNHALPDGNKRTAWAVTFWFVEVNGGAWADLDPTDVVATMVAIAAHDIDEDDLADWMRERITWGD
jgi:death-on-curing protein